MVWTWGEEGPKTIGDNLTHSGNELVYIFGDGVNRCLICSILAGRCWGFCLDVITATLKEVSVSQRGLW